MIQVHVAVKAVEVRVLSRAHKKTPSDAAKRDLRAFFLLPTAAFAAPNMQVYAAKGKSVGKAWAKMGKLGALDYARQMSRARHARRIW